MKITILEDGFEYKATIIQTSGVTETGNCRIYWQGDPKEIDMSQYIPIEWIKKKIEEKKERFVGYCDELTPVFVMYEQVLSDWEKENDG